MHVIIRTKLHKDGHATPEKVVKIGHTRLSPKTTALSNAVQKEVADVMERQKALEIQFQDLLAKQAALVASEPSLVPPPPVEKTTIKAAVPSPTKVPSTPPKKPPTPPATTAVVAKAASPPPKRSPITGPPNPWEVARAEAAKRAQQEIKQAEKAAANAAAKAEAAAIKEAAAKAFAEEQVMNGQS